MSSTIFFFFFVPLLSSILLAINLVFAPNNPYMEKKAAFECGFSSFLGQNRTQFSISFFIFALLFLLFDLEILLVYPYLVSAYVNESYGLTILLLFLVALTLGFAFELGKKALTIDSRQTSHVSQSKSANINIVDNMHISVSSLCHYVKRPSVLFSFKSIKKMQFSCSAPLAVDPSGEDLDKAIKAEISQLANLEEDNKLVVDLFKTEIDHIQEQRGLNDEQSLKHHSENADLLEDEVSNFDYLIGETKDNIERLKQLKANEEAAQTQAQAEAGEAETVQSDVKAQPETYTNGSTSELTTDSTGVPSAVSTEVPTSGTSSAPASASGLSSSNQDSNIRSVLDIDEPNLISHLENIFAQDILQFIGDIPLSNLIIIIKIITIVFAMKSLIR